MLTNLLQQFLLSHSLSMGVPQYPALANDEPKGVDEGQ